MRFSLWPNLQQPWDDVLGLARHADATGWDGVYLADHFMGDGAGFGTPETPTLEATAGLAASATATTNVRLGPLVLGTTYRHPAVTANWAASVDHICHGRFLLGIGAGWQENEHQQYGIHLPPVRERVDRFAETCEVLHGLLRGERTTFDGTWFQLDDALCEPKPVQQPMPLLIGGKGDRMLGITARYADEWNMWSLPPMLADRGAVLDRRCEQLGRDPSEIRWSTQAVTMLTDDEARARQLIEATAPRPTFAGTAEALGELVGQWRDAGLDELIVPDFVLGRGARKLDAMDEIIERVAPAFR